MNKLAPLALLVVILLSGCGQELPPAADPQRARSALTTALDTWKAGESLETLQAQTPAIYFNDELSSEKRLLNYNIEADQANGRGWRCEVLLTLAGSDGKETQRRVGYLIDTDPAIVIVQQP